MTITAPSPLSSSLTESEHMELGVKGQAEGVAVKWHPHTSPSAAPFAVEDGRAFTRGTLRVNNGEAVLRGLWVR